MRRFDFVFKFFLRFRYPVSLPEDVANALGINLSNHITFQQFIDSITSPQCKPTKLTKFMPREEAESAFYLACRKERFTCNSLFSFYFNEGWIEFILKFDEQGRLRRVYFQHKLIPQDGGVEIPLS